MRAWELLEAEDKTAVFAFGRMNPITIGHKKIVDTITQASGDPFLFLTHTQNAKKDPLTFAFFNTHAKCKKRSINFRSKENVCYEFLS